MGIDLKNKIFGRLTALKPVGINKFRQELWECLCSCGNICVVNNHALTSRNTSSCGCLRFLRGYIVKDLTNKRFGKLLIIKHVGFNKNRAIWLCLCDCGKEKNVTIDNLSSGTTVSCGCEQQEWYKKIDLSKPLKRIKSANGYLKVRVGRSYVLEHRIIMEQYLKRKLHPNENVHHINGNKEDNRIENLEIMKRPDHTRFHGKKRFQ